jgi:PAS domain S-box-containing protein
MVSDERNRGECAREQSLRELFATIPDAVVVLDAETKLFLDVNPAASALYGYTREEFLTLRPTDVSAEPHESAVSIEQTLAGRLSRVPIRWHKRKDGSLFPVEISAGVGHWGDRPALYGVVRDATERKRAEDALRDERRRLQIILDGSPAYIFCKDTAGRMVYVNKAFADMAGIPQEQWKGTTVFDLHPRELAERYHRDDIEVLSSGKPKTCIVEPIDSPDGERWLRTDKIPLCDDRGSVNGLMCFAVDITELVQAEQALREREHQYRTLAESASDIPYSMTIQGIITYIGPQVARYGFRPAEVIGGSFRDFVLPEDRDPLAAELARFVSTGEDVLVEFRFQGGDGRTHWLEERGALQRDDEGMPVAIAGVLRDVTERKDLEKSLAEVSAQERRRFGQDLHDGLGQELTGLACLAACLQKHTAAQGLPISEIVDKLADRIQHAIESMRRIAKALVPVEIDELGLVVALEQLAAGSASGFGVPCRFRCTAPVVVEDNTVATELFRIAQEALANAARHARAHGVEIEMTSEPGSISLAVRDDGVGLPDDLSHSPGMGLRIMRYRAGLIGAALHVRAAAGGGTEIVCTVPRDERIWKP